MENKIEKQNNKRVKIEEITRGYGTNVIDSLMGSSPPYPFEVKYEEISKHLVVYQEEAGLYAGQRSRKLLKVLHKGEEEKAKKICKKNIESFMQEHWPDKFG